MEVEMKTCSMSSPCLCQFINSANGCRYEGYCDYQLPRDSRMQPCPPIEPDKQCTCGSTFACPIHGKI